MKEEYASIDILFPCVAAFADKFLATNINSSFSKIHTVYSDVVTVLLRIQGKTKTDEEVPSNVENKDCKN